MAEMLLKIEEKKEAELVTEFLSILNPNQKTEVLFFIQGAKFMDSLQMQAKNEKGRTAERIML